MTHSMITMARTARRPSHPPTSRLFPHLVACALVFGACASAPPVQHGTITTLSAAKTENAPRCVHKVPQEVCTRCNPHLVPTFKAAKDWCVEHDVAESQCFECHPDLTFDPLPPLPANADLVEISKAGEDVPALEAHLVPGKVTLFDFYAVWCAPCRKIDAHVFRLLGERSDLALRKMNVVSWETPLAERYLGGVSNLPYVVVYGKDGKRAAAISGLDLPALDRAIAKASGQ
ncbi:MAG TPA: thioredoxin family protein [Polyangia bacterium]